MWDMTSGYQGFHASVVEEFLKYPLRSRAHFYQTELRYLLRKTRYREIPIHYRAPSPGVSSGSLNDSLKVFFYYIFRHWTGRGPIIKTNFQYQH